MTLTRSSAFEEDLELPTVARTAKETVPGDNAYLFIHKSLQAVTLGFKLYV